MFLRGGHQGNNRIELTIPRDHPVDIVGKIGMGESEIDLGGLWVGDVDLELGTGEHFVEFSDPLPFPMGSFRVDSSFGEVEVRKLGEGSPRTVNVEHGIGELFIDLQGSWSRDAEIDVDFGIGESRLWLPEDVRLDIESASIAIGDARVDRPAPADLPEDAPTLTLSMTGSIGEVSIEYWATRGRPSPSSRPRHRRRARRRRRRADRGGTSRAPGSRRAGSGGARPGRPPPTSPPAP